MLERLALELRRWVVEPTREDALQSQSFNVLLGCAGLARALSSMRGHLLDDPFAVFRFAMGDAKELKLQALDDPDLAPLWLLEGGSLPMSLTNWRQA